MDFTDYVQPLIEADAEGNMDFQMVRGGTLILTEKNTYIIKENVLGELESFEKIDNDEVNSLKVTHEEDLTDLLQSKAGREVYERYNEEEGGDNEDISEEELIQKAVSETDVDSHLFARVTNRKHPATMFRVHLDKRAPTIYLDVSPETFVQKFLSSEIYRENYVSKDSDGL